ncbi:MAG: hypothetical protein QE284_04220 [Rhizobium sp.]|nr:hypothetical protein [Rhizobium sp.]
MGVAPMKVLNGGSLAAHGAPHAIAIGRRLSFIQRYQSLQALEETA